MVRIAYLSPITTTSQGIFNLSVNIFFISEAIFFVGEINVEIYSAPTIPIASPICRTEQSFIKSRALFSVSNGTSTVSYTHLRAHETVLDLVCRLLLETNT